MSVKDFEVFERYQDAGGHAFKKGVVTVEDRESYQRVFDHLRDAVQGAIAGAAEPDLYKAWNCRFSKTGGIQGQRPIDLWASIINADSIPFSRFPQTYVIASEVGVKVGFSVTIHETEYFDQEAKRKNRTIVPLVNAKLPAPESPLAHQLAAGLEGGQWLFGDKNRKEPIASFPDFAALLAHLKSSQSTNRGGGSIYRILPFEDVAADDELLERELAKALVTFGPLMQMLRPTVDEAALASSLQKIAEFAEAIAPYDPADDDEGRAIVRKAVAVRQGQGKFRDDLIKAYGGRCAITGCDVEHVLQAAHISPCQGTKSNHVSNGLLLRADIHTLFDLGLIRIDPATCTVIISDKLSSPEYAAFAGKKVACHVKPAHQPSPAALKKKLEMHS